MRDFLINSSFVFGAALPFILLAVLVAAVIGIVVKLKKKQN